MVDSGYLGFVPTGAHGSFEVSIYRYDMSVYVVLCHLTYFWLAFCLFMQSDFHKSNFMI